MLEGKMGYPVQKAMEILVSLGECYGARRMIPVSSGHLLYSLGGIGKGGSMFIQELYEKGGRFRIFCDTNPSNIDLSHLELGVPDWVIEEQKRLGEMLSEMGAYLSNTCTPYLVGNVPLCGEHVAWNESSAIVYANSVLGARTNREGGPSAIAAALTGRTPEYGFHLSQNRAANFKIILEYQLRGLHNYGTLGYLIGKRIEDKTPVLLGLPQSATPDDLKILSAGLATSGSVTMFHAVGVTPEAISEKAACAGKRMMDSDTLVIGAKEIREMEAAISTALSDDLDLVIIGCPHASIAEIRQVAHLLSGKRVHSNTELWILTSRLIKTYAVAMGYSLAIEESGAKLLSNTCPVSIIRGDTVALPRVAATNSAKMAYYLGQQDIMIHYGSLSQCIAAAISGSWG